jgi:hypothetical protein
VVEVMESKDKLIYLNSNKMGNQFNKYIKVKDNNYTDKSLIYDVLNQYVKTFKKALEHDCYHDIVSRNDIENKVTVAFLPISTSGYKVLCGTQNFDKIHVNISLKGYKTFYITRLLFHKTMPVDEYNQ